jgi:hypothetical protein
MQTSVPTEIFEMNQESRLTISQLIKLFAVDRVNYRRRRVVARPVAMERYQRRLMRLHAALAADGGPATISAAAVTTVLEPELGTNEWEELCYELSQGTLATRGLSPHVIRTLMQPSPDEPTETERIMATLPTDIGLGDAPRPLLDETSGTTTPELLDWLVGLRDAAVEADDYQRASYLHQLYDCVRPKPPLTLQDCAPEGTDAKAEFFLKNVRCYERQPAAPQSSPALARAAR